MNDLVVSIDSLRRDLLDTYAGRFDIDVATANIDRFAQRAAAFDAHYAGSLPCMPARREWLTGTQEFLWRPWEPIEPFDDTVPELLRQEGTVMQLFTDHYHYFQHDGYYESFNGFELVRGHELDAHRTTPQEPDQNLLKRTGDPDSDPPTPSSTSIGHSTRATSRTLTNLTRRTFLRRGCSLSWPTGSGTPASGTSCSASWTASTSTNRSTSRSHRYIPTRTPHLSSL